MSPKEMNMLVIIDWRKLISHKCLGLNVELHRMEALPVQ